MTEPGAGSSGSVCETGLAGLLRSWWLERRPGWVDPGWYDAPIRPPVRALLDLPLGPRLITALSKIPPGACPADHTGEAAPGSATNGSAATGSVPGFPCACQLVVATAWQAVESWVAAQSARALVTAAGAEPVVVEATGSVSSMSDPAREEIAVCMRLSPGSAANRIHAARTLTAQPELLALVGQGLCPMWTARSILSDLVNVDPATTTVVVEHLAAKVRTRWETGKRCWTATELRTAAKRIKTGLHADRTADTRRRAETTRRVEHDTGADGMSVLLAHLPETQAYRVWRRLTALAKAARQHPDETRTLDQIRADLLTDLLLGNPPAPHGETPDPPDATGGADATGGGETPGGCDATGGADATGPRAPGRRTGADVGVNVVIRLETLLGLSEDPAELTGLGPIDAETARELAADGAWRTWITDASGTVTTTGCRTYTPTAALARLIRAREPHCRMPGCRQPARACDLDHTVPWPNGPTTIDNLGPLCRRHHQLKTHHGWQLQPHPDDDTTDHDTTGWTWTTPTGITITDQTRPALE